MDSLEKSVASDQKPANRPRKWLKIAAFVGILGISLVLGGILAAFFWITIQRQPQPRSPYLQSVTPDSIWIVWDTTEPVNGRVQYGQTPALGQSVVDQVAGLHHEVQLLGLKPYHTYYYRVDEGETSTFRTAAGPDQSNFQFAVYGDTREGYFIHRSIVRQISAQRPDFLIHTGDLVESGRFKSEWDTFFRVEAPLLKSAPIYPTLGNHEDFDPPVLNSYYTDIFHLPGNELWYAFDYGNARFICLKADGYPIGTYFLEGEQLSWLEEQLSANTAPWLFVYFHIGVFTSREEGYLETGLREQLVPLFEKYGVDLVFMGHHHSYERVLVNGITYIVTAGGGAGLYPFGEPEPDSQAAVQAHHFVTIEMAGDRLSGTAIDQRGTIIDQFVLDAGN